ncbi:hypothetical protein NLJ89_g6438 [Agrocybe chaxingu]|uniref:Uncharacterized protein n=1 Tax=Agrocybe chaxingu TaxID=84603 RepID=A0A9W8K0T0_9AGAR|nr:hypothetical protein NLJ89_g6438 [Agrocybe chaxingu]
MTSHKTKRSFKFSPLDTTDDDAALDSFPPAYPGSREIILKVCTVEDPVVYEEETPAFASMNMVNFKAKAHLVTFVFKYRPLATLQRMGIIPQPGKTKRPRKRKLSCIQVKEEDPPAAAIGDTSTEREKLLMLELESLRNENDQLRAENRRVRKKLKRRHHLSVDLSDDAMDLS